VPASECPSVREAALAAIPDGVWTEPPLAVAVPADPVAAQEVLDFLRQSFAQWQVPNDVVVVDEIPKTGTGKLNKRESRARVVGPGGGAIRKSSKHQRLRRLRWVR